MIVPCPYRLRGAAALVLGDHMIPPFPDVVRYHSSHHLLHTAVPRVVAIAFTAPVHAHESVLGVIRVHPDPVPGQVAARVVAESRPVHARYAVRLYSRRLPNHHVLQLIAARRRVPHRRKIPIPVVIVASRPRAPTSRSHEPADIVIGE